MLTMDKITRNIYNWLMGTICVLESQYVENFEIGSINELLTLRMERNIMIIINIPRFFLSPLSFLLIRELKAASGEWMNDFTRDVQRSSESHSNEYLSTSEIIRKSIRRSWTITSTYKLLIGCTED